MGAQTGIKQFSSKPFSYMSKQSTIHQNTDMAESNEDDLQLEIEERLYTLATTKLEELGDHLKTDVRGERCRRHKVRKIRQTLETMVDEHVEEGNLATFLQSIVTLMDADNSEHRSTPETGQAGDIESSTDELPKETANQLTPNDNKTIAEEMLPKNNKTIAAEMFIRREFKISGSIGGENQKDRLSFIGLMRQIDAGQTKGYKEREIIDAVIRAVNPSCHLKGYLEIVSSMTLQELTQILRVHYKEKTSTELYQELTSMTQDTKESPQDFLLRALSLRERVIFASKAEDALKYDTHLVQSLFMHAVETGLRDEIVRSKVRSYLKPESSDQELMAAMNKITSVEGERHKKFNTRKDNKASCALINSETTAKPKVNNVMSTLEALQAQITQLNAKVDAVNIASTRPQQNRQSGPPLTQESERPATRRNTRKCKSCEENNINQCDHCFKCGSRDHFARGCKSGNWRALQPRDRE